MLSQPSEAMIYVSVLTTNYLKYISKVELREIDFYKRREDYLERQLFRAARELKEKDREMVRLKGEG